MRGLYFDESVVTSVVVKAARTTHTNTQSSLSRNGTRFLCGSNAVSVFEGTDRTKNTLEAVNGARNSKPGPHCWECEVTKSSMTEDGAVVDDEQVMSVPEDFKVYMAHFFLKTQQR